MGYNDTAFPGLLRRTEPSKESSGGHRHLLVSSLSFRGERVTYPELLNAAREAATGTPSRFHVGRMPSLGAITLVSFLRRRGLRAELVDFYNEDREQLRRLPATRRGAVAITTTCEARPIREIVGFVREHSPSTRVIVGGPHIFNACTGPRWTGGRGRSWWPRGTGRSAAPRRFPCTPSTSGRSRT